MAQIFKAFGNVAFLAQLYVVAFGTATAVLTTKLALAFLSRPGALLAGAFVALLPSQILWSSIVMKDALVWTLLVALAVLVVAAQRARGWRLAACGLAAVAALVGLGFLRFHTLEIALVALLLASVLGPARGRVVRVAGAAAILLFVPLAFGLGAAGVTFVSHPGSLSERRANNAIGANTAVVIQGADGRTDRRRAGCAGVARVPAEESERAPDESVLHYAPKGLTVIALRPFPWEAAAPDRAAGIRLAGIEALLWYALLALAIIGMTTLRGRLRYMAFPLLAGSATALMYGVTEGNVGTAYRHRGEFVWVVALLAAMGVQRLVQRRAVARLSASSPRPRHRRLGARPIRYHDRRRAPGSATRRTARRSTVPGAPGGALPSTPRPSRARELATFEVLAEPSSQPDLAVVTSTADITRWVQADPSVTIVYDLVDSLPGAAAP